MRTKKLRGHKRIWKEIAQWRDHYKELDLDILKFQQRAYVKIWVSPFCDYSLLGSEFPEPRGKTRELILEGLLDIHDSWKKQLDTLGEPYYLKIWLYDPWFSRSQVVCALGSALDFYHKTFYVPEQQKNLQPESFGNLQERMAQFHWQYAFNEKFLSEEELFAGEDGGGDGDRKNKNKILSKSHRHFEESQMEDRAQTYYAFKLGTVWLGEKKTEI